ncbi:MAG: hypothetical protein ACAI44_03735, partial [Candidatus Sericytochromatia bacterium]
MAEAARAGAQKQGDKNDTAQGAQAGASGADAPARQWFGTDGVRGVANRYLTPELALNLAMAAATVLKDDNLKPKVLIAKDTRMSGDMFEAALAAGFTSVGWDVELLG